MLLLSFKKPHPDVKQLHIQIVDAKQLHIQIVDDVVVFETGSGVLFGVRIGVIIGTELGVVFGVKLSIDRSLQKLNNKNNNLTRAPLRTNIYIKDLMNCM